MRAVDALQGDGAAAVVAEAEQHIGRVAGVGRAADRHAGGVVERDLAVFRVGSSCDGEGLGGGIDIAPAVVGDVVNSGRAW